MLAARRGDLSRAGELAEESLALARQFGARAQIAELALNSLGNAARDRGEHKRAEPATAASLSLRRALGDRWAIAVTLNNLGSLARTQGDLTHAIDLQTERLALQREVADTWVVAYELGNLLTS